MHQQKGKKILIYFFLLFFVGSINNINLNNLKLNEINFIKVSGLGDEDNLLLLEKIKSLNLNNIFSIDVDRIKSEIQSNSLVEKYYIFKKYPSSININIEKTKFLARVNIKGQIFFVGSNGKLIKDDLSNDKLPFIFGNPGIDDFLSLKIIIDQSTILYDDIKNLYFFPSKRWDLELKNNTVIKLSNNNIKETLSLVLKFLHSVEFKDVKMIDARIKNQIILND
ncbi:FtsQ-type POTRA domain-containing protein [Candidatus Pelagibacter sp.]|nr:FtsQ-type POTRA domain-containing protein [Candidatus Pelagibacter sp.]